MSEAAVATGSPSCVTSTVVAVCVVCAVVCCVVVIASCLLLWMTRERPKKLVQLIVILVNPSWAFYASHYHTNTQGILHILLLVYTEKLLCLKYTEVHHKERNLTKRQSLQRVR